MMVSICHTAFNAQSIATRLSLGLIWESKVKALLKVAEALDLDIALSVRSKTK